MSFETGARVWGEWVAGRWYPGRVSDARGPFRHVSFDDGESGWLDVDRLVEGPIGSEPPIASGVADIGARVDAEWKNGLWYPGVVAAVIGGELRVDFDDGDVSTLAAAKTKLRVQGGPPVKRAMRVSAPETDATVLACAGPRTPWVRAVVESVSRPLVEVRFQDGSRASVTVPWIACPLDESRDPSFPPEGASILAEWVPGRWYSGEMGRIVGPRGHVVYDDGTKAWLTPWMIAALCA